MTTMTRDDAIDAAHRAARLVWEASGGPGAFEWYHALRFSPSILAQYVGANRGANAMQLYRFCVAGEPAAASWLRLPPPQRVSIEVFRATYLTLQFEIDEAKARAELRPMRIAAVPPPAQPVAPAFDAEVTKLEQQWAADNGRPKRRGKRA